MKKPIILVMVLGLSLVSAIITIASDLEPQTRDIPYTHSFTKAICTTKNFCQDYEIFCKKQEVIGMSPITGAAVQFSENWQDPRSPELRNKFC